MEDNKGKLYSLPFQSAPSGMGEKEKSNREIAGNWNGRYGSRGIIEEP